jgi:hypothetical protein
MLEGWKKGLDPYRAKGADHAELDLGLIGSIFEPVSAEEWRSNAAMILVARRSAHTASRPRAWQRGLAADA